MWRGPWQVGSPPQSWRPDKLPFKQTLTHQPVATVSVSLWWSSADRSHSAVSVFHLISFSFAFFLSIHLCLSLFCRVFSFSLGRFFSFSLSCSFSCSSPPRLLCIHFRSGRQQYLHMHVWCRNKPVRENKLFVFGLLRLECVSSTRWQLTVLPCLYTYTH